MLNFSEPVALITDVHANLEALEAVINDIESKKIKYIFSLGDIVGLGPNPKECMDIIIDKNIINILGNNDYYNIFPFETYRHLKRNPQGDSYKNAEWTKAQLSQEQIDYLKSMPPSIDIKLNDKLIALCHFPCDVRYHSHATWEYLGFNTKVFYATNTENDLKYSLDPVNEGVKSALKNPIFDGKTIDCYDDIIFGHYHFPSIHLNDYKKKTSFYSLNATGVAIENEAIYYLIFINQYSFYYIFLIVRL